VFGIDVVNLLRRLRRRWRAGLAGLAIVTIAGAMWLRCAPLPPGFVDAAPEPSTVVVDRHGHALYESLSTAGTRVERVEAGDLPSTLVAATVAAEDHRFYSHAGVDPRAWARALHHNISERRVVEGGSTVTQQIAKLLIQQREGVQARGIRAKLREAVLALRLEHRYSKPQLMALYLNLASYGNQTAGAARASRLYFGVTPAMLTPAQAAFLAALPQRPSAFNPWRSERAALARQRAVLRQMAAAGDLTADQLREALAERLALDRVHAPFAAPHFTEMVLASTPRPRPARLETTLDLELQREIGGIVERQRPTLAAHGAANVAVLVLDNRTAEWLAWEGSGNYFDADHGGAINGPLVPRQPGSALKPFTYAVAFEQGRTPATVLPDIPAHFPTAEPGVLYSPRNYDGTFRGPLLARKALAGSENVPAVALASDVGVPTLLRFLARAGLTTFDRNASYYGLGVTLGNAEVRLDELVAAYAAFARGGVWRQPTAVSRTGAAIERTLVSPRTAFWITDILSDADARAFVFGRGGSLEFPFTVAVKTGTSQAYHDNWTIGYTRDVTVGVWVGNFDRTPLHDSSGVTGAGPIFHAVMLAAERRVSPQGASDPDGAIVPQPEALEQATICALSGMRANAACPARIREWLPRDADPQPCDWHHESDGALLTIYPPEFRAWAARAHGVIAVAAPVQQRVAGGQYRARPQSAAHVKAAALAIANPPAGAIYSVDPTLRREFQALALRAVTTRPTTVTWLVDGRPIGAASSEKSLPWPLAVGTHEIEARDPDGLRAVASVVVK
jgi:penicillin-binding protein 1C